MTRLRFWVLGDWLADTFFGMNVAAALDSIAFYAALCIKGFTGNLVGTADFIAVNISV